jgi:hypothetical protein
VLLPQVITAFISILSDYIVDTVFGAAKEMELPVLPALEITPCRACRVRM